MLPPNMLLRDPVHGLVSFEGRTETLILSLLATREVQRLRRIKQLGLSSLVFPGAEHSRFAHALGAAHLMTRLLARMVRVEPILPAHLRVDGHLHDCAVAAALLHDLGHGPFSHLFEEVVPNARSHEAWTYAIIAAPSTEVHQALLRHGHDTPQTVLRLLQGTHPCKWLSRWISGVIDVDRCDYLLRDSQMSGVAYGIYDLNWLLEALTFAELPGLEDDSRWSIVIEGRKGLPPIEGFFLARHFMYSQVYHHKATRAGEALIRALFVRLRELTTAGVSVPFVPDALAMALSPKERTTENQNMPNEAEIEPYIDLDDTVLQAAFSTWTRHADPILRDLAIRVRDRRLPKTLPLDQLNESQIEAVLMKAKRASEACGLRADLYVGLDEASDVPYLEHHDDPQSGLWVSLRHQPLARLSSLSFTLERLVGQTMARRRLCFPDEIREQVV